MGSINLPASIPLTELGGVPSVFLPSFTTTVQSYRKVRGRDIGVGRVGAAGDYWEGKNGVERSGRTTSKAGAPAEDRIHTCRESSMLLPQGVEWSASGRTHLGGAALLSPGSGRAYTPRGSSIAVTR